MHIFSHLQEKYNYTDYEIKLLHYFFVTVFSEISKFLIIGIFFAAFSSLPYYIWVITVLLPLRYLSGGLHCKSYIGCLCSSFLYVFLCIKILPSIQLPLYLQLALLLICIIIAYYIAPISELFIKVILSSFRGIYAPKNIIISLKLLPLLPYVYIFDEATSALDQYSESIIHDAIQNIGENKTIIIVAHRESAIKLCDRKIEI